MVTRQTIWKREWRNNPENRLIEREKNRMYYEKNKEFILIKNSFYRPIYAERQKRFKKLSPLEKQQYFIKKYGNQKA